MKRIYLDYAASTPVDPRVKRIVRKTEKLFANPSAIHAEGLKAKEALEKAREGIGRMAKVKANEVYFTATGTESDNLAIKGVVEAYEGNRPHIITSSIEHPAILELVKKLDVEVSYVGVSKDGLVDPNDVQKELKENTVLVSIMQVNNEIGTIQPISKISRIVKKYRGKNSYPYIHTDASQGACYLGFELESLGVDMLTLDSVKVYGPRGVGALIKKDYVKISSILSGGGQEGGLRPGSENVPAIVGFEKALSIAEQERDKEVRRLKELRDWFLSKFPNVNGSQEHRLPNNINICFPGKDAEFLVIKLDHLGFAVSFASSCRSRSEMSRSYIIEELGKKECATSSLRITPGRFSKKSELRKLCKALEKI